MFFSILYNRLIKNNLIKIYDSLLLKVQRSLWLHREVSMKNSDSTHIIR